MADITDIEAEKALFLPDYQKLEQKLAEELRNPNLTVDEINRIHSKQIDLKLKWQRSGVANLDVVSSIRDTLASELETAAKVATDPRTFEALFGELKGRIARLDALLKKGKSKGMQTRGD